MNKIDKALSRLANLKASIAELDAERKALEEVVIAMLEEVGTSTIEWEYESGLAKATLVYSSSVKIDPIGLEGEMSQAKWRAVTRRVLDERLLEDKVARGLIDIEVVAKHSTETARKPFIKITRRGK